MGDPGRGDEVPFPDLKAALEEFAPLIAENSENMRRTSEQQREQATRAKLQREADERARQAGAASSYPRLSRLEPPRWPGGARHTTWRLRRFMLESAAADGGGFVRMGQRKKPSQARLHEVLHLQNLPADTMYGSWGRPHRSRRDTSSTGNSRVAAWAWCFARWTA